MKKKGKGIRLGRLGAAVGLSTLLLSGLGALGIVWLRMEISEVAAACGQLEDDREKVNRRLRDLRGQRSAAMRPTRIAQLVQGRLEMPPPSKQFYVTPEDMRRRLVQEDTTQALPPSRGILARNFRQ